MTGSDVAGLFDQLCLRWAREADMIVAERGTVDPTLVLLPRDPAADEVAIRVDGLRGNLPDRAAAILAELRPASAPHDPAGLVFLTGMRVGAEPGGHQHTGERHSGTGTDGVVVYVSLGAAGLRRALAYRVHRDGSGAASLVRLDDDPDTAAFSWLDALLHPPR